GGNVSITDTSSVTLNNSSAGGTFQFTSNGSITTSGTVTAADVLLQTTSNGNININNNVTGSNSVTLAAKGTGNVTQNSRTIFTSTLDLSSGSGNISGIKTPASSLTANTTGDVSVRDVGSVNLGASSGNNFDLSAAGSLTTTGTVTAVNIDLS